MAQRYANASRRRPAQRSGTRVYRKKKSGSLGLQIYKVIVALSAVIVVLYGAYNLFLKPPPFEPVTPAPGPVSGPPGPTVSSSPENPTVTEPPAPVRQRREGVYNFVLLGKDRESGNTDTIIIVNYDTVQQKASMISIPRDTAVDRDWSRYPKINAAYAGGGPDTVKAEIQYTFGIPIDYYIYVDLKGFIALVDELQGVDVYIPEDMDYDDPAQDLSIHYTKGNHHLTGQQAMEVVRFRHNNDGTGYNDEGRAAMQRQVLVALAKKVLSWNSIPKVTAFLDIFQTYVKTDLPANQMVYFATQALLGLDLSTDLTQAELTGRGDGTYKGYPWCYVFQPEDILPILNETVCPYDMPLTEDDLHLPVAEKYYFNY